MVLTRPRALQPWVELQGGIGPALFREEALPRPSAPGRGSRRNLRDAAGPRKVHVYRVMPRREVVRSCFLPRQRSPRVVRVVMASGDGVGRVVVLFLAAVRGWRLWASAASPMRAVARAVAVP